MDTNEQREQLEKLMEEYGTQLLRMCAVYLRDVDLAQDAVQDTFIKAYRHLPAFRGECSVKSWLMGIAINTCRDYLRTAWFRHIDHRVDTGVLPETPAPDVFKGFFSIHEILFFYF